MLFLLERCAEYFIYFCVLLDRGSLCGEVSFTLAPEYMRSSTNLPFCSGVVLLPMAASRTLKNNAFCIHMEL